MIRVLGALLLLAGLSWAAFYFYYAALIGELISWRFTVADWAQAVLVGFGPLALAVAAVRKFGGRLKS